MCIIYDCVYVRIVNYMRCTNGHDINTQAHTACACALCEFTWFCAPPKTRPGGDAHKTFTDPERAPVGSVPPSATVWSRRPNRGTGMWTQAGRGRKVRRVAPAACVLPAHGAESDRPPDRLGGRVGVQRSAPALPRAPALTREPPSPRTPSPSRSPSEGPSASGACSALVPGLGVSQVRAGILQGEPGGLVAMPCEVTPSHTPWAGAGDPGGRRGRGRHPLPGAGTQQPESVRRNIYRFMCTYFKIQRLKVNCQEAQNQPQRECRGEGGV